MVNLLFKIVHDLSCHHILRLERHAGRAATRTHQKVVANFTKRLTGYMVVAANFGHSRCASEVTLSISKSALSSHHQQTGSFQSHQQTTGEENAQSTEKWACLG